MSDHFRFQLSYNSWQDDLVNVSKFLCDYIYMALGADSDNKESGI